ncbi:hypothetical protein C8R43DRAFT_600179 [Mycena crocata]|nr:hypothetical protein C8R43DRAFT_600179 [Mycena crocata]
MTNRRESRCVEPYELCPPHQCVPTCGDAQTLDGAPVWIQAKLVHFFSTFPVINKPPNSLTYTIRRLNKTWMDGWMESGRPRPRRAPEERHAESKGCFSGDRVQYLHPECATRWRVQVIESVQFGPFIPKHGSQDCTLHSTLIGLALVVHARLLWTAIGAGEWSVRIRVLSDFWFEDVSWGGSFFGRWSVWVLCLVFPFHFAYWFNF